MRAMTGVDLAVVAYHKQHKKPPKGGHNCKIDAIMGQGWGSPPLPLESIV
jgi:hypothetical protein